MQETVLTERRPPSAPCHCSECKVIYQRCELRSASQYKNSRLACPGCYARIRSYRRKPLAI